MPFSGNILRYFALVSSSVIAGAGLSRSTIFLESRKTTGTDAISVSTESDEDGDDTLKLFKKWFYWSRIDQNTDKDGDAKREHKQIRPSLENKDQFINDLRLRDEYEAPKYPVVLCHGLSGFDKLMVLPSLSYLVGLHKNHGTPRRDFVVADHDGVALEYWFGIREALEAKGTKVMVAKVPGFGSIEERSDKLNEFISREVSLLRDERKDNVYNERRSSQKSFKEKGEKMKVNLIAHSMGGLDARFLISKLEKQNYEVVSLTTVTTPHRGSEMADYVMDLSKTLPDQVKPPPSFRQLTTEHMKEFNKEVTDDPKVSYFSYGAQFNPAWYNVFYASWSIINSRGGANDGMVSVESSKWGTYLGTLMNVDHLDLINWTNTFKKVISTVSPSEGPQIDSVALYLDIADNLAKRGL